jgi:hypothetical protein
MGRAVSKPSPTVKRPTRARVQLYRRLQNDVRRAINFFPTGEKYRRVGVDPSRLKYSILLVVKPPHARHLRVRKRRRGAVTWLDPEYEVLYGKELLFRLVWVEWPGAFDGRWHVRQHPDATWWR